MPALSLLYDGENVKHNQSYLKHIFSSKLTLGLDEVRGYCSEVVNYLMTTIFGTGL